MPKTTAKKSKSPPNCPCGPLQPLPGEKPIPEGTSAEQVLAKVQLVCDDNTGVFFFRHKQKLYLRIVEVPA